MLVHCSDGWDRYDPPTPPSRAGGPEPDHEKSITWEHSVVVVVWFHMDFSSRGLFAAAVQYLATLGARPAFDRPLLPHDSGLRKTHRERWMHPN